MFFNNLRQIQLRSFEEENLVIFQQNYQTPSRQIIILLRSTRRVFESD